MSYQPYQPYSVLAPLPQELRQLPFDFAEELTAGIDSGTASVCAFLQRCGVHNQGLWRRECGCSCNAPWGSLQQPALPDADVLELLWLSVPDQLARAAGTQPVSPQMIVRVHIEMMNNHAAKLSHFHARRSPSSMQVGKGAAVLRSWADYYVHRGLPPGSPTGPWDLVTHFVMSASSSPHNEC